MESNENGLATYTYRGDIGERVPNDAQKVIVNVSVEVLPDKCCFDHHLEAVDLNEGLRVIGKNAFACSNLRGVTIPSTTETIQDSAFHYCNRLTEIRFVQPSSLKAINEGAFTFSGLVEVNLSCLHIHAISESAFDGSFFLQTVRLPVTMNVIGEDAFSYCHKLVTVEVLSSHAILIEDTSFLECESLSNILIPQGSTVHENAFEECSLLHERWGTAHDKIIHGLVHRFDGLPVHYLCYHSSTTTEEEIRNALQVQGRVLAVADQFGMTPFHILCSSVEPPRDLFLVLLDTYPYDVLGWKDGNGKRAMDYLVANWSSGTTALFQMAMDRWTIESLKRWGAAASKVQDLEGRLEAIIAETDANRRKDMYKEASSAFERYTFSEKMTLMELALWKLKIQETDMSREACRCLCQADIVLPNVAEFLGLVKE